MEILAVSGIMDINTRKDVNVLINLLETLVNLQVTYLIDKIVINDPYDGVCRVHYTDGVYRTEGKSGS